jgi:hypothetical protein
MDPVTIFTILSGLLIGGSIDSGVGKRDHRPLLVRTIWTSGPKDAEQWRATELMSERALDETGPLFDLDLAEMWPMVESNVYRVVVLAELSGRSDRHVVFRAKKVGGSWELDVAYGVGGAKVFTHQLNRIEKVLRNMSWIQSIVDHPTDPRAQPIYNIDGEKVIWVADSYMIGVIDEMFQISADNYLWSLREKHPEATFALYAIVSGAGWPEAVFVLELEDGEYELEDGAGPQNRPLTTEQKGLVESFVTGLNNQEIPGVPTRALPSSSIPEERQLEVDELQDIEPGYDDPEYEYMEIDEEESNMRAMPIGEPVYDDEDDSADYDDEDDSADYDDEDDSADYDDEDDSADGQAPDHFDELQAYIWSAPSTDSGAHSVLSIDRELGGLLDGIAEIPDPYNALSHMEGDGPYLLVEWENDSYGSMEHQGKTPRVICAFFRHPSGEIEAHAPGGEELDELDPFMSILEEFFHDVDTGDRDVSYLERDRDEEPLEDDELEAEDESMLESIGGAIEEGIKSIGDLLDGDDDDEMEAELGELEEEGSLDLNDGTPVTPDSINELLDDDDDDDDEYDEYDEDESKLEIDEFDLEQ